MSPRKPIARKSPVKATATKARKTTARKSPVKSLARNAAPKSTRKPTTRARSTSRRGTIARIGGSNKSYRRAA